MLVLSLSLSHLETPRYVLLTNYIEEDHFTGVPEESIQTHGDSLVIRKQRNKKVKTFLAFCYNKGFPFNSYIHTSQQSIMSQSNLVAQEDKLFKEEVEAVKKWWKVSC